MPYPYDDDPDFLIQDLRYHAVVSEAVLPELAQLVVLRCAEVRSESCGIELSVTGRRAHQFDPLEIAR